VLVATLMRSITESELAFDLLVAADESEIERAADALRKEANGVAVPAGISAGQAPLGGPRATVTGRPSWLGYGQQSFRQDVANETHDQDFDAVNAHSQASRRNEHSVRRI
jgi:hypothetical protein